MAAILHPDDLLWNTTVDIPDSSIHTLFNRKLPHRSIVSTKKHTDLGAYHLIYFIALEPSKAEADDRQHVVNEIVLRVARPCFPPFKTENEVATITLLSRETKVPVPKVLFWSNGSDNLLGYEYIAMERVIGNSLLKVWRTLRDDELEGVLSEVVRWFLEMRRIQFGSGEGSVVGGLRFGRRKDGEVDESVIIPGQFVAESMWQYSDVSRYWPSPPQSFESLNPISSTGYDTYAHFLRAWLLQYPRNIGVHPRMTYARKYIPRIEALCKGLVEGDQGIKARGLESALCHGDLHMDNILVRDGKIAGIIDWEFASLQPLFVANPTKWMIWEPGPEPDVPHEKLMKDIWPDLFRRKLEELAPDVLEEGLDIPEELKWVEQVRTYLRCILEVVVRGDDSDASTLELAIGGAWEMKIEEGLSKMGF